MFILRSTRLRTVIYVKQFAMDLDGAFRETYGFANGRECHACFP